MSAQKKRQSRQLFQLLARLCCGPLPCVTLPPRRLHVDGRDALLGACCTHGPGCAGSNFPRGRSARPGQAAEQAAGLLFHLSRRLS